MPFAGIVSVNINLLIYAYVCLIVFKKSLTNNHLRGYEINILGQFKYMSPICTNICYRR